MLPKDFKSAVHVGVSKVSALGLLFRQLLDPLLQEIVFGVEDYAELRYDLLANFKG